MSEKRPTAEIDQNEYEYTYAVSSCALRRVKVDLTAFQPGIGHQLVTRIGSRQSTQRLPLTYSVPGTDQFIYAREDGGPSARALL